MRKLSQRLFAAFAAALGLGGMASAQYAQPNSLPAIPIPPVQSVPFEPILPAQTVPFQPILPVQAITVTQQPINATAPPTAAPAPAATAPAAAVPATIGCSTCGDSGRRFAPNPYLPRNTAFGAGLAPVPYAEYCSQCANGCGSLKSNLGFYFGSCKSFFNPCGPIPCNGAGGHCNHCGVFPFAAPYGKGYSSCVYDSYMNH
jgi:hypothetical protein